MIIPLSFPFLHIQSYVPINSNVLSQDDSYARLTLLPRFTYQVPLSWSTTLTVPIINCTYIYIWVIINHSYLESYQDHRFFWTLTSLPINFLYPSTNLCPSVSIFILVYKPFAPLPQLYYNPNVFFTLPDSWILNSIFIISFIFSSVFDLPAMNTSSIWNYITRSNLP